MKGAAFGRVDERDSRVRFAKRKQSRKESSIPLNFSALDYIHIDFFCLLTEIFLQWWRERDGVGSSD